MKKCEIGVIRKTSDMARYGRWIYGLHPSEKMIEDYVSQGVMYYLEEGNDIAAAAALTPYQGENYHGIDWQVELSDAEVAVVHLLAVNPKLQKRGFAKMIMEEIIELAKTKGMKAVRLDALDCNVPAHRLYESLGFKKRDVRNWYASNTGWIDFYLFEYLL